jgi:hypothetical protein
MRIAPQLALIGFFFGRRRPGTMRFHDIDAGSPAAFHCYPSLVALLGVKLFHS